MQASAGAQKTGYLRSRSSKVYGMDASIMRLRSTHDQPFAFKAINQFCSGNRTDAKRQSKLANRIWRRTCQQKKHLSLSR